MLIPLDNHRSSIPLTKTTAAQNEVALIYHSVRGLYFLAVVFVATIICSRQSTVSNYVVLRLAAVLFTTFEIRL